MDSVAVQPLTRVFHAMAHGSRWEIVGLLSREPDLDATSIARAVDSSLQLVVYQLKVLTLAGVLTRHQRGRKSHYALRREAITDAVRAIQGVSRLS